MVKSRNKKIIDAFMNKADSFEAIGNADEHDVK